MTTTDWPTTENIRNIFCEEIAALDGRVQRIDDDGWRLYCRATLPLTEEVARGDRIRAGAAMRATRSGAVICPYILRVLCVNGMIMRQSLQAHEIERPDSLPGDVADWTIREAIRLSCTEEAFVAAAQQMRAIRSHDARRWIEAMLQHLRLNIPGETDLVPEVSGRFRDERDPSAFGLMNAVTSVARDTADPETRWRLEELGGAIAAGLLPAPPTRDDQIAEIIRRELLAEGLKRRAEVRTPIAAAPEPPCEAHSLT